MSNDEKCLNLAAAFAERLMRVKGLPYDQALQQAHAHVTALTEKYRAEGAPYGDDDMGLIVWLIRDADSLEP